MGMAHEYSGHSMSQTLLAEKKAHSPTPLKCDADSQDGALAVSTTGVGCRFASLALNEPLASGQ
jgi:hypothetical protein